jgi:hypothetical protein
MTPPDIVLQKWGKMWNFWESTGGIIENQIFLVEFTRE